ncbi:MAG: sodium:solute symporter [Gemmatimonadota bacterium]|jgi:SSS family transporter
MSAGFGAIDVVVLIAYLAFVIALGASFARGQKSTRDYFLGGRGLPWWAICFSVVATETSALTFISLPATAYQSDFWFLQLALGYIIGRLAVAALLLPRYFAGEMVTVYAFLETRFGGTTRRFASIIFMVTRALADSVRMFAAAIPIRLVTGIPYAEAILAAGVITVLYTWLGGLKAVVWIDVAQMFIYIVGGVAALVVLLHAVPGGWGGIVAAAEAGDKLRVFHTGAGLAGFADPRWLFTGLIGGAFLSMASHGVDFLIVQRLLAARSLADGRKAIIGSGLVVAAQFALFLFVGVGLFAYYGGRTFATPDEIFPRFILEAMPPGLTGLIVAGIVAAMMSTVSSSLNSLASAAANDLIGPLTGRTDDDAFMLRLGRRLTLGWAVVLVGGAVLFQYLQQGTPVVVVALQIASFTYGGLLGGFLLGVLSREARESDAIVGMGTAIVVMGAIWGSQQFGLVDKFADSLWFSLLGSAITVGAGLVSSRLRRSA